MDDDIASEEEIEREKSVTTSGYRISKYGGYVESSNHHASVAKKRYPIVKYSGYVVQLGAGSAYGGNWMPSKPDDERFLGTPGQIKTTGDKQTKIGSDGRASIERHNNDAPNPKYHSNPHDHEVLWNESGQPRLGPAINYWKDDYPDGAPVFKGIGGLQLMEWTAKSIKANIPQEKIEQYRFSTIREFCSCLKRGGEVNFLFADKIYGVFSHQESFVISEIGNDNSELASESIEDILDYQINGQKLRGIVSEINVFYRSI